MHRSMSLLLALKLAYAIHVELAQLLMPLLCRILVRLPRNITTFKTLSDEQRRYLLGRIAANGQGHARSLPLTYQRYNAYCPSTIQSDHVQLGLQKQQILPVVPDEAGLVSQLRPARDIKSQERQSLQSTPGNHLAHFQHAGYSVFVNIGGDNNFIDADEILQQMGRQIRICQVREQKLFERNHSSSERLAGSNNLVINVTGSGCVVGRRSTFVRASKDRKRHHGEMEQEHADGAPAPRRRRQD